MLFLVTIKILLSTDSKIFIVTKNSIEVSIECYMPSSLHMPLLKGAFTVYTKLIISPLSSCFFSNKPSAIMADVGELLWLAMLYIVSVVVHLYLGL